ncbi:hypothetical protein ADK67_42595 [Saccharothrix sp. NRRL B-16348]|uniref:hypothetical protein n=1 Tax=Saccharothrix sp. NRRL B-16348 TaxID=1415542 RepID=UPI0006C2C14D|nr:hypothetical protein [Saccharothrix sp. NRRL B-16348]KOX14472.1 hypothetical protein ADK67_42595 [Saccharothrix sp. NRRL B-16348]
MAGRPRVPAGDVFARNYGQAGAIERYGPDFGLPRPFSGHMSNADWGPPPDRPDRPVVVVGARSPVFTGCRVAVTHEAVVENEEHGTEVSVCDPGRRGPRPGWDCAGSTARNHYARAVAVYPGFDVVLARLARHRGLDIAALALKTGLGEAGIRSVFDGALLWDLRWLTADQVRQARVEAESMRPNSGVWR